MLLMAQPGRSSLSIDKFNQLMCGDELKDAINI